MLLVILSTSTPAPIATLPPKTIPPAKLKILFVTSALITNAPVKFSVEPVMMASTVLLISLTLTAPNNAIFDSSPVAIEPPAVTLIKRPLP